MDEILFQRGGEGAGNLDADIEHLQFGKSAAGLCGAAFHTATVGELHGDEVLAFHFAEVENLDDVRMVERRNHAGFLVELVEDLLVATEFLLHQLHRHLAFEDGVEGAVNGAHAAAGDGLADFKIPEQVRNHDLPPALVAGHGGHGGQIGADEIVGPAVEAVNGAELARRTLGWLRHGVKLVLAAGHDNCGVVVAALSRGG
jgi:hypothetical protein